MRKSIKDLTGLNNVEFSAEFIEPCDVGIRAKSLEERDQLPCGLGSVSFAQLEELDRNVDRALFLAGIKKPCDEVSEEQETWQALIVAPEEKAKSVSRYDGVISELSKLREELADKKYQDVESMVDEITALVMAHLQPIDKK